MKRIALLSLIIFCLFPKQDAFSSDSTRIGLTFSHIQCDYLGLDWKQTYKEILSLNTVIAPVSSFKRILSCHCERSEAIIRPQYSLIFLPASLPADKKKIALILDNFINKGLMIESQGKYLSLAVTRKGDNEKL
jgi:hypothetical protein